MRNFILTLLATISNLSLLSQICPLSLQSRLANAQVVIEAEVIHSQSYYGKGGFIYTSHVLEVQKLIKGNFSPDTVEIVLRGGTVDGTIDWLSHHLYLSPGQIGMFFLVPHPYMEPVLLHNGQPAFDVYSDLQGCIRYIEQPGATVGSEPFRVYNDINQDLYPLVGWQWGNAPRLHQVIPEGTLATPEIDSIRPLTLSAGTRSVLTIHGRGFLDTKGKVYFNNSDDGGATRMTGDTIDIQVWTDTLVSLWVPSVTGLPDVLLGTAGTGSVVLQTNIGDSAESRDNLVIQYAIQNNRDAGSGVARYAWLIDNDTYNQGDSTGGYTFQLSNSFSTTASAETAFRKAIRMWRCATGVNFKLGTDTTYNTIRRDSVNIVKWDDGPLDNLPANVLARTEARLNACPDVAKQGYFTRDIDFVFSRQQAWNFDTTLIDPTKWDFLSVALHEMGHAQLLYHVIDSADLMHFSIDSGGTSRILAGFTVAAGFWVVDSSVIGHGACPPAMTRVNPADCNSLPIAPQNELPSEIAIYPNPSGGRVIIQTTGIPVGQPIMFNLYNAYGDWVPKTNYIANRSGPSAWELDIASLPSAMYFLRIETEKSVITRKILLIR